MADDLQLLAGMRDCGFDAVFIGIETPSLAALRETGKIQNLKADMPQAVRRIQSFGIEVMAGFIMGFDSDSPEIADRQIAFIQQTGIPQAMVGLLTALPGTQLFKRLQKENRLMATTDGNNTHCLTTNFKTRLNADILKESYKKVLSTIYDSNLKNYFGRCNVMLDNLGSTAHQGHGVSLSEIRMLWKSLKRQPFTTYGFQYLKFLVHNLVKKTGRFPDAVKLAIVGHHFHTITQAMLKRERVMALMDERYQDLQRCLQHYTASAQDNYWEALQNVIDLWHQKGVALKLIRKKIDRLHVDFRDDMREKYGEVADRMRELFEAFENELVRNGIRPGP